MQSKLIDKMLPVKIFLTGGIVLGLELLASRVLTPFFGASLYVWSAILSVTLIALALGYKIGGIVSGKIDSSQARLLFVSAGALAALWMILCVWTYPFFFWKLATINLTLGSVLACTYILLVPLVILSGLNPLLVALLPAENKDHGAGSVFFISTIGSVFGVFAVAYGLLPYMTNYKAILLLSLLLSLLSIGCLIIMRDFKNKLYKMALALSVITAIGMAATMVHGGLERLSSDVEYREKSWKTVYATPSFFGNLKILDLYNDSGRLINRSLLNDGLMQNQFYRPGLSANLYTYALERLALAAVENPQKALVLGIGAGVVPGAFASRGIEVQAVDINPKMVPVAEEFLAFDTSDIDIKIEDARTAARSCSRDNDIAIVDLFREDGVPEYLVTYEFFADVKHCLKDGGVVVMNAFTSTTDLRAEHALLKTISAVFDEALFLKKPSKTSKNFAVGYIVARKNGTVGELNVSTDGMPQRLGQEMLESFEDNRTYTSDAPEFADAPLLSDVSNQWKRLVLASEIQHRQQVISKLPWQVLMN